MKEEHTPQEITEQIRRCTDAYIKQVINFSQIGIEPVAHCFVGLSMMCYKIRKLRR